MKRVLLTIVFCFAIKTTILAQSACPQQNLYTNFLNDGRDTFRLKLPLTFRITTDSVVIKYAKVNRVFAAFRILSKTCFWNQDFSEGRSEYKLMLYDVEGNRYPSLNIIVDKKQPVYIELLYENAEKRVFTQL